MKSVLAYLLLIGLCFLQRHDSFFGSSKQTGVCISVDQTVPNSLSAEGNQQLPDILSPCCEEDEDELTTLRKRLTLNFQFSTFNSQFGLHQLSNSLKRDRQPTIYPDHSHSRKYILQRAILVWSYCRDHGCDPLLLQEFNHHHPEIVWSGHWNDSLSHWTQKLL